MKKYLGWLYDTVWKYHIRKEEVINTANPNLFKYEDKIILESDYPMNDLEIIDFTEEDIFKGVKGCEILSKTSVNNVRMNYTFSLDYLSVFGKLDFIDMYYEFFKRIVSAGIDRCKGDLRRDPPKISFHRVKKIVLSYCPQPTESILIDFDRSKEKVEIFPLFPLSVYVHKIISPIERPSKTL